MRANRLFLILCLGLVAASAHAQQSSAPPQWAPSPTLIKKLGQAISVEGFLLQPPADYKLVIPDTGLPDGVTSYIWVGPGRKDETHPTLMLMALVPPFLKPQNLTLNQIADSLLVEIKEARRDWVQTPAEAGIIQGMKFVRIGWTGVDPKEKRKMQGWMMVAREGDTVFEFSSQDVLPEAQQSLPLAETAARTFKRLDQRVFFSVQWPGHAQIYAMNPDGSNRVCLTPNSDTDSHPTLSPDGTTIAFTTHRDGVRALYLMNLDGTNQRRLTQKEDAGLCAWSPDGSQLAFSSNRDGHYGIYVMDRDGSNVRQVTKGPADDSPDWSPNGLQIAYEGAQDQTRQIFVVNVDGTGTKALTKGKGNSRSPRWSPAGDLIVYSGSDSAQGKGQIYLMHPDGTMNTRLTKDTAEDRQPSFTADSRQILFHSDRGGKFEIYVFDLDSGKEQRLVTESKDTGDAVTLGRAHPPAPSKAK